MKVILLILSLSFFSCEMHKQESIIGSKRESLKVDLTVIESLLSSIYKDDYFSIEETLSGSNFELNVPSEDGKLLLNEAIKQKRLLIGALLVKEGADPNVAADDGVNALSLVDGVENKTEWQNIFNGLGLSKDYSESLMFTLLSEGSIDTQEDIISKLSLLIDNGASLSARNERDFTYLMIAGSNAFVKIVNFLCSFSDTDPNATVTMGRGRRARTFSAYSLSTDNKTKEALIACGADPNI